MGGGFGGDLGGLGGIQVGPAAPVDFAKSTGAAGPTWIPPKPPRSPPNPPPIWPPPLNTPEESVQTYSYYRYPVFVGLAAAAGKWAGAVRDQMNYPMCARFGSWWKLGRSRANQRKPEFPTLLRSFPTLLRSFPTLVRSFPALYGRFPTHPW